MNKAIKELQDYALWRHSIDIIPERIKEIDAMMVSLGGGGADAPVKKSGNEREKKLCALIDEKTELLRTLDINRAKQEYIERGLSALNDVERKVLEGFYMSNMRHNEAREKLMDELGYVETSIEKIRNVALKKYSMCEFGR